VVGVLLAMVGRDRKVGRCNKWGPAGL